MKFVHVIYFSSEDNYKRFEKYAEEMYLCLKKYLEKNKHNLDKKFLINKSEKGKKFAHCETNLYILNKKGEFDDYNYIIFSHIDILIKKLDFLEYINENKAYGRPSFAVISKKLIKELSGIKVKFEYEKEYLNEESKAKNFNLFGLILPKEGTTVTFSNGIKTTGNIDRTGHIFMLNELDKLYPSYPKNKPANYAQSYDFNESHSIIHLKGAIGKAVELFHNKDLIKKTDFLSRGSFYWIDGLCTYLSFYFNEKRFTKEEVEETKDFFKKLSKSKLELDKPLKLFEEYKKVNLKNFALIPKKREDFINNMIEYLEELKKWKTKEPL